MGGVLEPPCLTDISIVRISLKFCGKIETFVVVKMDVGTCNINITKININVLSRQMFWQ